MRVVYDISELAWAHLYPGATTGIHRVVLEVARGLHASPECDLSFCATSSAGQALEYLRKGSEFSDIPLLDASEDERRLSRRAGRGIARINRMQSPGTAAKVARRALMAVTRLAESRAPLTPALLAGLEVFHAPFAPLPESARTVRGLRRFQTVYDLIPMLHPEYFAFTGQHQVARMVRELHADDWVLAISECTKQDLLAARPDLSPERIVVTPLAADRERFRVVDDGARIQRVRARYGIREGPYLLSLNTLEPRKNLDRLIRAFRQLAMQERVPGLQLVLVGRVGLKSERIFEALALLEPDIRCRIVQAGYVADDDLATMYSGATAFVYPSLYEGFGLPPLEAMQCGVPVVASSTSAIPEVVGDAGLLVAPTDEEALAQAMLTVCTDDGLRQRMGAASLARAAQFSWERCARQTLDAYRTALGQ